MAGFVYRCYSAGGRLLYLGRIAEHGAIAREQPKYHWGKAGHSFSARKNNKEKRMAAARALIDGVIGRQLVDS